MIEYIKPVETAATNKNTGLSKFRVLPENFKLQVAHLPNGCIETNLMGLELNALHSFRSFANYYDTMLQELMACIKFAYDIDYNEMVHIGTLTLEGAHLVQIRSTVKPRKGPTIETEKPVNKLTFNDAIDV